jgi:5'-3' exonuclease
MEVDIMWDEWTAMRTLNIGAAWESIRSQIVNLMRRFETNDVVFALSGTENWRKDVLPTYKANRAGVKKPAGYGALRELALQNRFAAMHPRLEADDLIGIRATKPGHKCVIVSSDKDMRTLPGAMYHPQRDEYHEQVTGAADYMHMVQTLTGDTSDGYAGCPGMGPVKAEKLLAPFLDAVEVFNGKDAWQAIVAAYAKAGLGEDEAIRQARVARILRWGEFNFGNGEVKLWTPT